MMTGKIFRGGAGLALAALLAAGCAGRQLPRRNPRALQERMPGIPENAVPVLAWQGRGNNLMTYWGRQDIMVSVRAWLPEQWRKPGDGFWQVQARNARGIDIPVLGVVDSYRGRSGEKLALIVPEVNLDKLRDGLYAVLVPGVSRENNQITRVQPEVVICEVRNHAFKPFRVAIPLIPDETSALTPMPELPPEPPAGTPVPLP